MVAFDPESRSAPARADPQECDLTTRVSSAVREESRVIEGARGGHIDPVAGDPKPECPLNEMLPQVEEPAWTRSRVPERLEDVGPDLIARSRDRRTQMEMKGGRRDAQRGLEPGNPLLQNPGCSPPPPGVQKGHGPRRLRNQKHRHAVRHRDSQQNPGRPREMAVHALALMTPRHERGGSVDPDVGPMDLPGMDHRREGRVETKTIPLRCRIGQPEVLDPALVIVPDGGRSKEPREPVVPEMANRRKGHGGVWKKL
jgi:hypothetical protein